MLVSINWKPNRAELRKFGLTLIAGFALIGALLFFKGARDAARFVWAGAAAVGALAIVAPPLARPFYVLWMGVAFVMGTITSAIVLVLIFYLIVTPIALVMRVAGRDALALKRKGRASYWSEHPPLEDNSYYERLF